VRKILDREVEVEMDERLRRIGQNEALFRQVNEEIEALERGLASIADNTLHIVCECGVLQCDQRIVVPVDAYEHVRADSALFFVVPGHEIPSAEDVVEAGKAYNIVRKHEGVPQRVAKRADPRS
jgi:hypothetical protein